MMIPFTEKSFEIPIFCNIKGGQGSSTLIKVHQGGLRKFLILFPYMPRLRGHSAV